MKGKVKALLIIIFIIFLGFTFSSVLNYKLKVSDTNGVEVTSITRNISISPSNVITFSDAFLVKFNDYNSYMKYEIPCVEENYNIKISDIDVITSSSTNISNYKLTKENNNIVVNIKNNGYMGTDNIVVSYKMNKGEDYDYEKDSFNLVLFNSNNFKETKDFSFNITFPKVINTDNVTFMCGNVKDSQEFEIKTNSNIITGTYKKLNNTSFNKYTEIKVTFEEGYFKNESNFNKTKNIISILYFFVTFIFFIIWFVKGKDETIRAEANFFPPDNFNPLELGYWIDNNVDYSDIFFMLIHWANEGYIKITKLSKQDSTDEKSNYVFKKLKELNINKPAYEKLLFKAIFELGKTDETNDEFNTKIFRTETDALYGTLQTYVQNVGEAEEEFNNQIKACEVESYDPAADKMFTLLKFICIVLWIFAIYYFGTINAVSLTDYMPILIAMITGILAFFVSKEIFLTYAIYASPILLLVSFNTISLPILISILLDLFLTAIVRKRTFKYNDLLGKIYGFRNVICKDKYKNQINEIQQTKPYYFYYVLPFALVLYKGKEWAKHFKEIYTPQWYNSMDGEGLSKENINDFIKDMEMLCSEILTIVNLSATADKKKEAREGMSYVSRNDRIRNAGFDPSTFDNDDEDK